MHYCIIRVADSSSQPNDEICVIHLKLEHYIFLIVTEVGRCYQLVNLKDVFCHGREVPLLIHG